jgi:hypothetical protein
MITKWSNQPIVCETQMKWYMVILLWVIFVVHGISSILKICDHDQSLYTHILIPKMFGQEISHNYLIYIVWQFCKDKKREDGNAFWMKNYAWNWLGISSRVQ